MTNFLEYQNTIYGWKLLALIGIAFWFGYLLGKRGTK